MTVNEIRQMWSRSEELWWEDDCAPDAERLDAAIKRLFGQLGQPIGVDNEPPEFLSVYEYKDKWVLVCRSYRGNNGIKTLTREV